MFQLFDGIQAVSAGVLRGLGDTRAPFVINLAGFWLCGFPVSLALAFGTPLRALGLWWGLVAGLVVVASLLAAARPPPTSGSIGGARAGSHRADSGCGVARVSENATTRLSAGRRVSQFLWRKVMRPRVRS